MPVCIWCRKDKPSSEFNVEHVMPQSFGTFEQNFTLVGTVVCQETNSFFSKVLEPSLAKDSLEGFDRYRHGLRKASEFTSLGKRSTTRTQFTEGPYAGAWGYTIPGHEILGVIPFPQIGFAATDKGPFEWFMLDQLPTMEQIKAKGFSGNVNIRLCECDDDDATKRLAELGIHITFSEAFEPPSGGMWVEQVFRPGLVHRRALAKIAMNYLAYQFGREIALEPRFDAIRNLVMDGVEPGYPYYSIDEEAILEGDKEGGRRVLGHMIVLAQHGDEVEVTVSLYNRFRHKFVLANTAGTPLPPRGHYFDTTNRRILPLGPAYKIVGVFDLR
jgi:HNH endonuclease